MFIQSFVIDTTMNVSSCLICLLDPNVHFFHHCMFVKKVQLTDINFESLANSDKRTRGQLQLIYNTEDSREKLLFFNIIKL